MNTQAVTTILDMLYDAYQGGINHKTDPAKRGLTMRVLYSAVRRVMNPDEFTMVLEQIVASGKATADGNKYTWIQH